MSKLQVHFTISPYGVPSLPLCRAHGRKSGEQGHSLTTRNFQKFTCERCANIMRSILRGSITTIQAVRMRRLEEVMKKRIPLIELRQEIANNVDLKIPEQSQKKALKLKGRK